MRWRVHFKPHAEDSGLVASRSPGSRTHRRPPALPGRRWQCSQQQIPVAASGCSNRAETCSLAGQGTRVCNQGVRPVGSPRRLGGRLRRFSSWLPGAPGAPHWQTPHLLSSSRSVCLCVPRRGHRRGLGAAMHDGRHLTPFHLQRPCFQVRLHPTALGGREFGGHCSPPDSPTFLCYEPPSPGVHSEMLGRSFARVGLLRSLHRCFEGPIPADRATWEAKTVTSRPRPAATRRLHRVTLFEIPQQGSCELLHIADRMSPKSPLKQAVNNAAAAAGRVLFHYRARLTRFNLKFIEELPPLLHREKGAGDTEIQSVRQTRVCVF